MSKSRFSKILVAILALCLIAGTIVGASVVASASRSDAAGSVITFDEDYTTYLDAYANAAFADKNTWEVIEVDGNKVLHAIKHGNDTPTYNGGAFHVLSPTYVESGSVTPNLMVYEFDIRVAGVTNYDNQITMRHQGQKGNQYTPFLKSIPTNVLSDGKQHHITITYQITERDEVGSPIGMHYTIHIDDSVFVDSTECYAAAKYLAPNGGAYKLPEVTQIDAISFDLNNSFYGEAFLDNMSLAIVHEHRYNGETCLDCGYVNPDFNGPVIYSKNVEYGSKTYLRYAVTVESISEADKAAGFWMQVTDENGEVVIERRAPEAETVNINGKECYVFISRGVPAKELNTREEIQIITASGLKSAVESYSVEDYLYQKLYNEGYAAKSAEDIGEDGRDYIRRTLYYNLLEYGALAQELLAPDAADKIGDRNFATAPAAKAKLGELKKGTTVLLELADTSNADGFIGWEYTQYDNFGKIVDTGYARNKSMLTVDDGYFVATPVYWEDIGYHITFDDEADADNFTVELGKPTSNQSGKIAQLVDGNGTVIGEDANTTEDGGGIRGVSMSTSGVVTNGANKALSLNKMYKIVNGNLTNPYLRFNGATQTDADASVAVFETDILLDAHSNSNVEIYFYLGPTGCSVSSNAVYYGYFKTSGKGDGAVFSHGYDFKYETGSSRQSVTTNKSMGVKTGTSFNLRIEYWEAENVGDAVVKIYADGVLVHETTVLCGNNYYKSGKAPQAEDVDMVNIQIGGPSIVDMQLDNVALAQLNIPNPKLMGVDPGTIDFASVKTGYTPSVSGTNSYEVVTDEITGQAYLVINKSKGVSGGSIKASVTEKQANANLMVYEADIYVPTASSLVTQINAGHTHTGGSDGNNQTPFMPTINTSLRDQWVRIRIEYQALEVDASGNAVRVCLRVYENGKLVGSSDPSCVVSGWNITPSNHPYTTNGVYTGATKIIKIPLPSEMTSVKIALNQACAGSIRFDNISLKLLYVEGCDPVVSQ